MESKALGVAFEMVLLSNPRQYLEEIGQLRKLTWENEGADPSSIKIGDWLDDHDDHALHWAIFVENRIVAAARMCIHSSLSQVPDYKYFPVTRGIRSETDLPVALISRLVVHLDFQGQGFGSMIDQARINKARELSAGAVLVRIGPHRKNALTRLGFIEICDASTDPAMRGLPPRSYYLLRLKSGPRQPKDSSS